MAWSTRAVIGLVIATILSAYLLHTLNKANVFQTLVPIPLPCEMIPLSGEGGSEDVSIDQELGIAFISSGNFFRAGVRGITGGIFTLDLSAPKSSAVKLHIQDFPSDVLFNPHGIGLLSVRDPVTHHSRKYLFAVIHDDLTYINYISKFEYTQTNGGTLTHIQSWNSSDFLNSPNDVSPATPDTFYLSNDHGSYTSFGKALEDFFNDVFAAGDVTYFDGTHFRALAKSLSFPNGVNYDVSQNILFVAECLGKRLLVFTPTYGSLQLIKKIEIDMAVDNIEIEDSDHVLIGGHPNPLAFLRHAKNPKEVLSPSQVVRVNWRTGEVQDVYVNDGSQISGLSTAAIWKKPGTTQKELILGSVFGNFVLRCSV